MAAKNFDPATPGIRTQESACRLTCAMSIGAFISFAAIDPLIIQGSILQFLLYRSVIVTGGLIVLGLTWTNWGRKNIAYLSVAIATWTGVGVILLTELAGGSSSFYWTMVMLTYFTCSVVLPIKTRQAFISFTSVALFYFVWLTWNDARGTTADWVASNAGIWLSLVLSVLAVKFHCRIRRQRASQHRKLQQLNDQLKRRNRRT